MHVFQNELPIIGESVISVLESGVNKHGVDPILRIGVINQAIGVSLLMAAGKMDTKLALNLRSQIEVFEESARDYEHVKARNTELLFEPTSGLNPDQILLIEERVAASQANAEYIRDISFAATNFFVDYIQSQSDLRKLAVQVGRNEKGKVKGGVMHNGHYITKGIVTIQY